MKRRALPIGRSDYQLKGARLAMHRAAELADARALELRAGGGEPLLLSVGIDELQKLASELRRIAREASSAVEIHGVEREP